MGHLLMRHLPVGHLAAGYLQVPKGPVAQTSAAERGRWGQGVPHR